MSAASALGTLSRFFPPCLSCTADRTIDGCVARSLRPLTWTRPKPLVPFANRPMVLQQVAALRKVGVTEIVLAVNYQSETFAAQLAEWEKEVRLLASACKR